MGIAQSKSANLGENLKCKTKNEYGKDNYQEEDGNDDSPKENCTNDSCNKKDESSLFYGTIETQVSEGGEADLHKHVVNCKKNPGHKQFVPVNDFNINHLPKGCHDNNMVELIKATVNLTVRVDVKKTSRKRPKFWPNTREPYAFYDKRGSDVMRLGTGTLSGVNNWTHELRTCPCHKCQHSDTPSKVWGDVEMFTATHVVFDDLEARHTTCRLFYDKQDSPLVTLDCGKLLKANIEDDWCALCFVTCDVDLLDKLRKMWRHWEHLWWRVWDNHWFYKEKWTFIVSHPHGCPKQISVGQCTHWFVGSGWFKYTHTACTCPGSSGAYIHTMWYDGENIEHPVHSGVNSEGINFGGSGELRLKNVKWVTKW